MEDKDQTEISKRGSDLNFNAQISLEEALQGTTISIKIPSLETCSSCYGKGYLDQNTKCRSCKGQGKFTKEKEFNINIPPGIKDGERLCMVGQGEAGINGASSGDLYVIVTIRQHYLFQRKDNNLYYTANITNNQLGTSITIPTLDGQTVKVDLPVNVSSETTIEIPNKGMPIIGQAAYGSLYVCINLGDQINIKPASLGNTTDNMSSPPNNYLAQNRYNQPYSPENNFNNPYKASLPNQNLPYQSPTTRPNYIDQPSDISSSPNNNPYNYSPYNVQNMQLQKGAPYPNPHPQPLIVDDNFWDRINNQIKSYAMLSFAFSVLGLFCLGVIIGPISFVLSTKALNLIDDHNIGHMYKPWALAGKYLGVLSFIINSILLLFILFGG